MVGSLLALGVVVGLHQLLAVKGAVIHWNHGSQPAGAPITGAIFIFFVRLNDKAQFGLNAGLYGA